MMYLAHVLHVFKYFDVVFICTGLSLNLIFGYMFRSGKQTSGLCDPPKSGEFWETNSVTLNGIKRKEKWAKFT
jgi:hypothetical protein